MTLLDSLRRPDYTGENRCWPCTAINLVVVAVAAAVAARRRRSFGPLVLLAGAALVYLRGYVVPGTPTFAPKLVARLPVDVGPTKGGRVESGSIGDDAGTVGADAVDVTPEKLLATLVEAGVLVEGDGELRLTDAFDAAFSERMTDLRALSDPALAERTAAVAAGDPTGEVHGNRILLDGARDVWLSRAVAIAETAAAETLAEFDVDPAVRAAAAEPLRTFVRTCPVCAGDVRETTLRNCCGGPGTSHRRPDRPVLACEDCSTVVYEFDVEDLG